METNPHLKSLLESLNEQLGKPSIIITSLREVILSVEQDGNSHARCQTPVGKEIVTTIDQWPPELVSVVFEHKHKNRHTLSLHLAFKVRAHLFRTFFFAAMCVAGSHGETTSKPNTIKR